MNGLFHYDIGVFSKSHEMSSEISINVFVYYKYDLTKIKIAIFDD